MPTLPDAMSLGERPSLQPTTGVASYEPPNFRTVGIAGQIVEGAGNTLQQASDIIAQTNQKYDVISAQDAFNQLKTKAAALEFDPQTGFTQAKGANAVGQDFNKTYSSQFDDAVQQIGDSLQNQQQKQIFQQQAQIASGQFQSALLSHQAQQTTAFANATDTATVQNSLQSIAAHPYDENNYNSEMANVNSALAAKFQRNGYSSQMASDELFKTNSAALSSRTQGMMLNPGTGPVDAAAFFAKHETEFDADTRNMLGREIKTTNDAINSRLDGQAAYQTATAKPSADPLPADKGADIVKPYSAPQITSLIAQVKAPSQYDSQINAAATQYGVSPAELKLRIMAESGGNANAGSSQGAVGLGQLTADTAKSLGVTDRTDPTQSINATAKLMAQYGGTVGGDMSHVDQMYYGPNSPNGPNTQQYVENLRAVRTQLFGATQTPQTASSLEGAEGSVVAAAKQAAQLRYPGNPVYQDQVVAEARKNWASDLSAQKATDYSNFSGILSSSIGPSGAKGMSDLTPQQQTIFAQLPPENQHSLMNLWQSNQNTDDKVTPTPDTDRKTLALLGQAINDPVAFKSQDIVAATQGLPRANQNQVYAAWQNIDKTMAQGANVQKALSIMRPDMRTAKINIPSAAEKGSAASFADYNAYTSLLSDAIVDFQNTNKRAPTQQEVQQIGRPLLAQAAVPGVIYGTNNVPTFKLTADQQSQAQVPMTSTQKQTITTGLKNLYGYTPTPSMVQQAYLTSILHPGQSEQALAAQKQFHDTMIKNKPANLALGSQQ